MKRYLKAFLVALAILILLMALVPFVFKGRIRGLVEDQANKNLNAKVSLGGLNISLFRYFPRVYLGLTNLTVTNLEPFEGDTLAHIPLLAIRIDLVDLFSGAPYQVEKIRLVEPDIRLRVMHNGQANWDIALPPDSALTTEEPSETSSFSLHLHSLTIENGRLVYDDVSLPAYVVLEGLSHQLSGDLTESRTTIDTKTGILNAYIEYDRVPYLVQSVIELDARVDADLTNEIYYLQDNHLKINDLLLNFEGSIGYVGDDLNLMLTFQAPENTFKNLLSLVPAIYANDFSTVRTDGRFALEGYVKGIYNETDLPSFRLALKVADAWFQYPELPGTVSGITLDGVVENPGGATDNTVVDLTSFRLKIMDNPITGNFRMKHPVSDPDIDLKVQGTIDLSEISQVYPLEEGDELQGKVIADVSLKGRLSDLENENYKAFQALGSFLINDLVYSTSSVSKPVNIHLAQVNFSPAYLDLVTLDAKIGNSDFKVKGKIEDWLAYFLDDGVLRGNFFFDAGRIDLNELMQEGTAEEEMAQDAPAEESLPDTLQMSAFLIPSYIDITLNTTIGRLDYETIEMKNLKGNVGIRDSKLILKGLTVDVFGGRMLLNGSYETSDPSSPVVDFALGITEADIGQLFEHIPVMEKFAPVAAATLGKVTANLNLASVLDGNMMPLYETVQGLGSLKSSTLQVSGVNTLNALSDALKIEQLKILNLDPVNISFQFMEGMLNVKPFDLKAGNIAMNLGGWTSFTQEIGYELNMKVPRSIFGGQANDALNSLVSKANQSGADVTLGDQVELKALIDGTLTDPKLRIDLAGTGKGIVEEIGQQVKQEVTEKAGEEAEKILREAREKADALMAQARAQADNIMNNAQKLADETRKQANINADKIEKEAKDKGTLAVLAAKKTADEVRKEGDRQAQNIISEAQKQSDNVIQLARQESDKILEEANKKAELLK